MNENTYPFTLSRTEFRFEFVSISAKKEVRKVVLLTETAISKIYNLALLDLLENGELSDMAETSNDDFKIVIATVIQIINNFLDHNHHIFVIFSGSDSRRHRLYRIILSRELIEISKKFVVFGVNHDVPYPFEINTEYEFCLIGKHENTKKKNTTLTLTGEQIVQKKLDKVNAMLKKMDLSKLPGMPINAKHD